ncbi:sulfate adenylyltransferase subunit CysN [Sphingomonas sp. BT-65]|uniref:sulfate adenylyltransferase subunit CysN n=1 Tax=Sphingomonas sp. BT-65 TaxID=2989821 RepID=UPI002236BEA2|nr:sulfate adenylyltransferase subunit CysN [Sphingomonas sp. BT-65]MCW4463460.1 sulfate adenylyltransferase subunit CysN [Sphingomonas sp. BT-65]
MAEPYRLVAPNFDACIAQHQERSLLRFLTCGSVDDGKSTLIGRLLYDSKLILEDQLASLEAVSSGRQSIDFASLVDGLAAEREQGITIDVAYRFFATGKRKFIVADTPGHEQYTRNMVTGASTADLAVILIDARKGVLTQTRRHSYIVQLLGIRHIVLAVNKMDLVGYQQAAFDAVVEDYAAFARQIGIRDFTAIPISGRNGDNIAGRSDAMPWYSGPALLEHLETVEVDVEADATKPFRMPVQWVNRAGQDFRGLAGTIPSGVVRPGDPVRILPSGRTSRIARIVTLAGDLELARAGQSVTVTLADEIDCSRGDVIAAADAPLQVSDQFEASLVWLDEAPLLPGRRYLLQTASTTIGATVMQIKHAVDLETLGEAPARTLACNQIAVATLRLDRAIPFAAYAECRTLGSFVLVDRESHRTLAGGTFHFSLRRADNIHWQPLEVRREQRAAMKAQVPKVLWFTGLSGAGKSTIANQVERKLHALGYHTFLLDGDNVRHRLNGDLGFTDADRVENIRRVGEVAALMADAGLVVLAAFISPFRAEREMVRAMVPEGEFVEIFIDTPLGEAEARDVKGLYQKARRGELVNFTGIDSPYEPPLEPDLQIDTMRCSSEQAADQILAALFP